jgi:hypothetical protein
MVLPIDSSLAAFGASADIHRRTGFAAGVFVDAPASSLLSFETGALVSLKGTAIDLTQGAITESGKFRLLYLDVPLLACADLLRTSSGRISLLTGLTVDVNVDAKFTGTDNGQTVSMDLTGFPAMDYAWTAAGRVQVRRVLFELRYDHGLRNLGGGEFGTAKNRALHVMTGWRF